nr:spore coat U domain-containing protein [Pseudomonas sp. RIT-PI-AD]
MSFCLLFVAGQAHSAGQVQGQMNVQMTIGSGCTVTNGSSNGSTNTFGTLNFGEYPSLDNIVEGSSVGAGGGSSFGLQCSTGTNYSVAIDSGLNASGTQRRMSNGGAYISYNLYQDTARTVPWGNGSNGGSVLSGTGSGAAQEVVVYGRVPVQATPAAGTYLDTVQVTVTW